MKYLLLIFVLALVSCNPTPELDLTPTKSEEAGDGTSSESSTTTKKKLATPAVSYFTPGDTGYVAMENDLLYTTMNSAQIKASIAYRKAANKFTKATKWTVTNSVSGDTLKIGTDSVFAYNLPDPGTYHIMLNIKYFDDEDSLDREEDFAYKLRIKSDVVTEVSIEPCISYFSTEENTMTAMSAGDNITEQAPLTINCIANIAVPEGYTYEYDWEMYDNEKDKDNAFLRRHNDPNTSYTFSTSGGYEIRLIVIYRDSLGNEVSNEDEPYKFNITISESNLICPDAFTPNGDNINDVFRIQVQSIVKIDAVILNRWGVKVAERHSTEGGYVDETTHTYYLDIWDGKIGNSMCQDGVYYLQLEAWGSDGLYYRHNKTITVLKGYREENETDGGTGS